MKTERLQKALSRAGIASRRKAEELIREGRVRVDGRVVTELGTKVDLDSARIEVDGKRIVGQAPTYIVLHKPRGVMCTLSDPEGRTTVAELVKGVGVRVVPVGRLDYNTSGVLLLTNDGDFAAALGHPRKGAPKVYVAKVHGIVDERGRERLAQSIEIDGRQTQPAEVHLLRVEGDKTWLEVLVREGRNRQVRRLGEAAGFPVMRLARTSFAGVSAEGLRPGEWRHLTSDELVELKRNFGVPRSVRAAASVPGVHGRVERSQGRPPRPRTAEPERGRPPTPERGRPPAPERGRPPAPERGRPPPRRMPVKPRGPARSSDRARRSSR